MQYPGQRGQIDVKYVPKFCLTGEAECESCFQYIFMDGYSWYRVQKHMRSTQNQTAGFLNAIGTSK